MTIFQVDLDKLPNYLWYYYEKQWCWRWGVKGVQAHPQKMWFAENLGSINENPHKNGAQHCLTSKNGAQGLQKNTWRVFWRSHQKGLNNLCGENS